MISPITSSTTLRVLEYGALNTPTPRAAAAARSTWLVPMQKQPIATRSGARLDHLLGHRRVGADAEQADAFEGLDQLALGESAGAQLDLEATLLEELDGGRMDVLQEQDLHGNTVGAALGVP